MPRIRGQHAESAAGSSPDAGAAHQLLDRLAIASVALGQQLAMDPRSAVVGMVRTLVNLADPLGQLGPPLCRAALGPTAPGIVAAAADFQHAALHSDRPDGPVLVNEAISHGDSLAKKAVAFFKISRSMVSRRTLLAQPPQLGLDRAGAVRLCGCHRRGTA